MSPNSETPKDPNIIETTAIEKPAVIEGQAGANQEQLAEIPTQDIATEMETIAAPGLDSPDLKVTRPPRPEARTRGMGLKGKVAAGVAAVTLTVAGAVAGVNALSDKGDSEPKNNGNKTEQVDEVTATTEVSVSPTADVEVDGVDPNNPVTTVNEDVIAPTNLEQGDSFQNSEVFGEMNDTAQAPINNEQTSVPEDYERTVVGPEAYPGEVSVNRSFDLANYLMETSAPTIDQFEDGTGAYVYQHESGAIVMINGKMNQGELARDRNLPIDGLTFTLNLPDGRSVTVTYEEGHEKAVTYALQDGTRYATEVASYMSDVVVDAQKASDFGAQISAEADSLIRANNK